MTALTRRASGKEVMQTWYLYDTPRGYEVELVEVPLWALAVSRLAEVLDGGDRHLLCEAPDWAWRIPLGRPHRDDGPFLLNSLGGLLYDLFSKAFMLDLSQSRGLCRLPVSDAQAKELEAKINQSELPEQA